MAPRAGFACPERSRREPATLRLTGCQANLPNLAGSDTTEGNQQVANNPGQWLPPSLSLSLRNLPPFSPIAMTTRWKARIPTCLVGSLVRSTSSPPTRRPARSTPAGDAGRTASCSGRDGHHSVAGLLVQGPTYRLLIGRGRAEEAEVNPQQQGAFGWLQPLLPSGDFLF